MNVMYHYKIKLNIGKKRVGECEGLEVEGVLGSGEESLVAWHAVIFIKETCGVLALMLIIDFAWIFAAVSLFLLLNTLFG